MPRIPVGPMVGMFAAAAGDRLRFSKLSKATLVELSHVLEDIIVEYDLPGVVLTGFQTSRNWVSELARYEAMATHVSRTVAVFADGEVGSGQVLGFRVGEGHPLTQEWFIIALTSEFSVALFGEDNPADGGPAYEMDRVFDAAWTFDGDMVKELNDLLIATARGVDPERADHVAAAVAEFPVRRSSPLFEQEFHHRVFVAMESGRRRWRDAMLRNEEIRDRLHDSDRELLRLERLATLGTTAASLAHELNNPLASISMTAELMQHEARSGQPDLTALVKWSEMITDLAARSGRMTRDILDLVSGNSTASVAPLHLAQWLQQFAEEVGLAHHRRVQVANHSTAHVLVDPDRLRHILTNLVVNGLQSSEPHTPVEIWVDESASHASVRVVDHGRGVPDEIRSDLFLPFRSTRKGEGGTGLGLMLARWFAEDQGCQLELTSTGPEGSTFTLAVPLADPVEVVGADDVVAEVASERPERHVLVLDDDADVRSLIGHLLRLMGWEVRAVADLDSAVAAVEQHHFDAVVIDYRLGRGVTGLDVVQRLEATRPGTFERSVIVTGSLASELPIDQLPTVLTKPFTRAELAAVLPTCAD